MANVNDYDLPAPEVAPEDQPRGTLADFGKTLGAGALNVGSNLAAGARFAAESGGNEDAIGLTKAIQDMFAAGSEGFSDSINPETKKLAAAALTSPEFLAHPILGTALKATGMLPAVAALALPGGLMADVVGATMATAAAGGALQAGQGLDEFYKKLDGMSDEELQKESPQYKTMRSLMGESSARKLFNKQAQGWAPLINTIIGAAGAAVGPAGTAARGIVGGAENAVLGAGERGAVGSAAVGAAEGAGANAAMAAGSDTLQQGVEMDAGMQKEFDKARAANAALEGGALGGIMGGAVGLVAGGGAHGAADTAVRPVRGAVDTTKAVTSDVAGPQVKEGSTGVPAKPAGIVANPQNAPATTSRDGGKNPTLKLPKKNTPPPPEGVTPDVAAATAANQSEKAPAAATEVAALQHRSPNETLDKLDQEGQPPAPTPPVTPEGNQLDTGANVPEAPASFAEQIKQIGTGNRKAVMLPKGTTVPASLLGGRTDLRSMETPRGRFIFDPKLVDRSTITKLSAAGRENEILGLGPVSKPSAVADAAAGATPVAITERTPNGTEVKAAAGTTDTLPEQRASLEAQKTPGNVVAVETPAAVVERRNATGGRILPDLTQPPEMAAQVAPAVELPKPVAVEPQGKRYSASERAAIEEKLAKAKAITDKHAPTAAEENYLRDPAARNVVIERAKAMLNDAEASGIKVQAQLKKSTKGDAPSDHPSIQILRLAKDLARVAAKRKEGREITEAASRFAEAERLIRGGYSEDVLAQRRAEGDAAMARGPKTEDAVASTEVTPESELAAKEGAVATSPDEVRAEASAGKIDAGKDDVKTIVRSSAKGDIRGVGDGTETTAEGVTRAKAASEVRRPKLTDEEKARYLSLGASLKNDKVHVARKAKVAADVGRIMSGEALRVDRNPTEAQKEAGNYKKGHRNVEGLDFTIENPKGAVRRGRGPEGEWSVHMPADYGYIRRTVGADGDHVDAYDGRSGKRYFIVDQLDPHTGNFDEHKVMMRFNSEEEAISAYHRAFSDGSGAERMGNIHEVSVGELKQWLHNGDTSRAAALHFFGEDPTMTQVAPGERVVSDNTTTSDGRKIRVLRSDYLVNELDRLNLSNREGVGGTLAKFFLSRFKKLAEKGDHAVHYVTREQMATLSPKAPDALGLHVRDENDVSHIYLRNDLRDNGLENGSLAHVLLHETAHAFTVREIENSPAAEATIRRLMNISADWMEHPSNAPHVEMIYGAQAAAGDVTRYAFTNSKEFIAEAFSNKGFQELLTQIPLNDPSLAKYLGLDSRHMSVWDMFRAFVRRAVEKVTGSLPKSDSVLDAIMKVGEGLELAHEDRYIAPLVRGTARTPAHTSTHAPAHGLVQGEAFRMVDTMQEGVKRYLESREANVDAPKALKLRGMDNIARLADHYFGGENNPVRKIHSALERMRTTSEKLMERSEPIIQKMLALKAQDREAWEKFQQLALDATYANVHPDVALTDARNAHLGKNALRGVWGKAQHPELARRFAELPPAFKEAWPELNKHYTEIQNKMTLGIMKNMVSKLLGHDDDALAQRAHEGNLTDADRQALGSSAETLEGATELSKIEGPYVPLMRRGDHVVKGDYKVTSPGNAKVISNKGGHVEFEFGTQKEAEDYAKSSKLEAVLHKVWIDPKTGERLGADELDSVARYRVTLRDRHVEFVQGKRAALARAAELAKDGSLNVHEVVPRSREPDGRQAAELSTALHRLVKKLEHSDAYKNSSPTERAAMRQALNEASLASHGSTRVSARALPRRNVKGASEDLVQGLADYGQSSSRYLAKLEYGPALEKAITEMAEQIDRDHSKTGQYARTSISNEVLDRVRGDNGFQQGGKFAPIAKRALAVSFADKLASPAYSIINASQPAMITAPYLAARHGPSRALGALWKAYGDIGARNILKEGVRGTAKSLKGHHKPVSLTDLIKRNLTPEERAMLDHNIAEGTIDDNAGMEISKISMAYEGVGGKVDRVIHYMEGVTREMPRAIEAINRSVTALATYRLERSRGASHEKAMRAATDAVNETQFNYSPTNAPPIFNHPLLKLALQFKKYGQGVYQLIGSQIGDAIRNESPGDRARAIKTLVGIAATHTAIAGALGLPTEPIKYLVMGASVVTGVTWGDVENDIRRKAAELFGKTGGEIVTRGLPRLLNLDLSRMGLDSVTSFGEPKANKENDVKSWLFDTVSGPVVSLGGDYIKGVNALANGDASKAAELMIPVKSFSDSIRAYRQATEGKKTATGKQSSAPYSPSEAAMRVLGFGTAREAEEGAERGAFYRQSQKAKDERNGLINAWTTAAPKDKSKAWAAIQQYNKTAPAESKITPKQLTSKAKSDAKAARSAHLGIVANKRDKRFLEEGVYNAR